MKILHYQYVNTSSFASGNILLIISRVIFKMNNRKNALIVRKNCRLKPGDFSVGNVWGA